MTFLDIIQTWNYEHDLELDNIGSMFEDIVLDERLDKETMVTCLLDECGAMESLYNTTPTFKVMSDNFFKKYQWNITKLADTLHFEYDPLKNKNLEWTETTSIEQNLDTEEDHSENRTRSNTGTQTINDTGTQTTNETGTQVNEFDGDETNTISAMNSSTYEPDNKTTTDNSNTRTDNLQKQRTDNLQNQRTDNLLEGEQKAGDRNKSEDLTWEETDTHTESGTNDISYQDLIEKERKIAQFSLYGWIAKKYAHELFLLVY